jgi:hypothetical protein
VLAVRGLVAKHIDAAELRVIAEIVLAVTVDALLWRIRVTSSRLSLKLPLTTPFIITSSTIKRICFVPMSAPPSPGGGAVLSHITQAETFNSEYGILRICIYRPMHFGILFLGIWVDTPG